MSNPANAMHKTVGSGIFSRVKKVISILSILLAFSFFASAQQNEFEFVKTQFHADKKTLLMNYMMLSDSQAAKFWPIYDNYEKERSTLADKRFSNLKIYAEQYKTMTNDQADKMMNSYFDNNAKENTIKEKYYNQMKKVLGAKTAAAWMQFEEYVGAAVRFEVLHNVPFLKEK